MLNTIKILAMFFVLILVTVMPKSSYAWDGQHRHGFHSHSNPDLTLVTGMDNIDSKVLIASGCQD